MEGLIFLGLILLVIWGWIDDQAKKFRRSEIDAHKEDLLKGGLIVRVDKDIHREDLSELGREHPNKKLPRVHYYD